MTLRRKLMAAFAGLAAIALLVAGVTVYATLQWQATTTEVETHYQRSLLLQRVRAGTFQALKEVDDALTSDVVDARGDFEQALLPAGQDFRTWAALADTAAERAEVQRVRLAHERLVAAARRVFGLALTDRNAAVQLVDDELDTKDFEQFRLLTERAVAADRARRRDLNSATETVRRNTQIMVAVSAISIFSLVLLISAYLAQDIFRPLRALSETLDRLRRGDRNARADEGRKDEIGAVARSLNLFAASIAPRAEGGTPDNDERNWRDQPTRATLHRLIAGLQSRVAELRRRAGDGDAALLGDVEELTRTVARLTEVGLPLDLELEPLELAALIHSIVAGHRTELARRAVSLELSLSPDLAPVLADRLKLRGAIAEAVRNALDSLPERGGRLGLRTYVEESSVRVEVGDGGSGMAADLIERALGRDPFEGPAEPMAGLALARLIAEQHGGGLEVFSETGRGTVVQFTLPYRR